MLNITSMKIYFKIKKIYIIQLLESYYRASQLNKTSGADKVTPTFPCISPSVGGLEAKDIRNERKSRAISPTDIIRESSSPGHMRLPTRRIS